MRVFSRISNYWLCQIGGWGLVGFSMLFYAVVFRDKLTAFIIQRIVVYMIGGVISTHLLRIFIKKSGWLLFPIEKIMPRLTMAIIATSTFFSLIVMGSFQFFAPKESDIDFYSRLLVSILNTGILIAPWVLIYYFYHYIEDSRRQQLDTLKLEALVKELELKTIKSHINPHFIFNALNSIRALIDENPIRARDAITELSNILRSSMQAEKLEVVPFEKELNIVKDYLALEHIRFEDRLKVEYRIDEETLDHPVPPMMLQTLVENAIKHGISKQVEGGLVSIQTYFDETTIELIVQNTGLLSESIRDDGFGISSTRNRLALLFGEKAQFEIKQLDPTTVQAKVKLPTILN